MMHRYLLPQIAIALMLGAACSDDGGTPSPETGTVADAKLTDAPGPTGDSTHLPWPDAAPSKDASGWSCTPGAPDMCDGYKTQYCKSGVCTACPASYVDCDRQGDCECYGACSGTKCVGGKR